MAAIVIGSAAPERYRPVMDARRSNARILYKNKDVSEYIAPWLLGVEYTDGLEKADDLQITLWDDGRWQSVWAPGEGTQLSVEIYLSEMGVTRRLKCGTFAVDGIEYSGPPSVATIKATSAYVTTSLRKEKKTRAWEAVSLKTIAQTVAGKAGLKLQFDAASNPAFGRIDQKSRSDLDFLTGLAEREGLRVKTSGGKLIIFSQAAYDLRSSVRTFTRGDAQIINYRFSTDSSEAYSKVEVRYRKPKAKKTLVYTYKPKDAPETGQTLRLNERCESTAEAERIAKNRLSAANRGIRSGELEIVGDISMLAGQNITVAGFGSKVNGLYAVEEAKHSLWPYSNGLEIRKI